MKSQTKKPVYVAMSGGVDSSVAAALLKKQGFNVVGVFMKPWQPEVTNNQRLMTNDKKDRKESSVVSRQSLVNCLWKQDREDAMRAAAVLDIPFLTWDFSREYKKEVTDYMIREYRAGRTPNPDVMCNKHIKFSLFLKKALKEGTDFISTGHYVRIRPTTNDRQLMTKNDKTRKSLVVSCRLLVGIDKNKDQSYFLWTLSQKQLKYCLFPIGDYIKLEVRKMAKKFGLPNHDKKDSQGVCFVGPLDMKRFLKKYIKPRSGKIIDQNGKIIGYHDGVYYYTIGQRHGLNITNGQGPYFVTSKDVKKNVIYVTNQLTTNNQQSATVIIKEVNWIAGEPKLPVKIDVKIRYRSESIQAFINSYNSSSYKLQATSNKLSFKAITPGQSAVFYKGEEMLGGGIIVN